MIFRVERMIGRGPHLLSELLVVFICCTTTSAEVPLPYSTCEELPGTWETWLYLYSNIGLAPQRVLAIVGDSMYPPCAEPSDNTDNNSALRPGAAGVTVLISLSRADPPWLSTFQIRVGTRLRTPHAGNGRPGTGSHPTDDNIAKLADGS